jgi:hypothetical protein
VKRLFRAGVMAAMCALVAIWCAASAVSARDLLVSWNYEEPMLVAEAKQGNDLTQAPAPSMPEEISPTPAPLPPEPSSPRLRTRGLNSMPTPA